MVNEPMPEWILIHYLVEPTAKCIIKLNSFSGAGLLFV